MSAALCDEFFLPRCRHRDDARDGAKSNLHSPQKCLSLRCFRVNPQKYLDNCGRWRSTKDCEGNGLLATHCHRRYKSIVFSPHSLSRLRKPEFGVRLGGGAGFGRPARSWGRLVGGSKSRLMGRLSAVVLGAFGCLFSAALIPMIASLSPGWDRYATGTVLAAYRDPFSIMRTTDESAA